MKDCVLNPDSPTDETYEVDAGRPLPKVDVLVLPGTGSVDFATLFDVLLSPAVGYTGPLLLEKVPGRTLATIDAHFARAKQFAEQVVAQAAVPKASAAL